VDDLWNYVIQELFTLGQAAGVEVPEALKKVSGTPTRREEQRLRATIAFLQAVNKAKPPAPKTGKGVKSDED